MKVWREAYRPFIFGGDVNGPIFTEATVVGPVDLGKGFSGFVVETCNGKNAAVEATSGAFIGDCVDEALPGHCCC